jgi:hypothetical protein
VVCPNPSFLSSQKRKGLTNSHFFNIQTAYPNMVTIMVFGHKNQTTTGLKVDLGDLQAKKKT